MQRLLPPVEQVASCLFLPQPWMQSKNHLGTGCDCDLYELLARPGYAPASSNKPGTWDKKHHQKILCHKARSLFLRPILRLQTTRHTALAKTSSECAIPTACKVANCHSHHLKNANFPSGVILWIQASMDWFKGKSRGHHPFYPYI